MDIPYIFLALVFIYLLFVGIIAPAILLSHIRKIRNLKRELTNHKHTIDYLLKLSQKNLKPKSSQKLSQRTQVPDNSPSISSSRLTSEILKKPSTQEQTTPSPLFEENTQINKVAESDFKVAQPHPTKKVVTIVKNSPSGKINLLTKWLKKVFLLPPKNTDKSLIAWWSTRVGLILGVIASVFLGVYVNHDTSPITKLCQFLVFSLSVLIGGRFIEKKSPDFGLALMVGGFSLLYVGAFSSYGLPALKVTDSAVIGMLTQALVLTSMSIWTLRRNIEGLFTLALLLSYITAFFALYEGMQHIAFLSFIILSVSGLTVYIFKKWFTGFWLTLLASSIGFISLFQGDPHWHLGYLPLQYFLLGLIFLLGVVYLGSLYCVESKEVKKNGGTYGNTFYYTPSITLSIWLTVCLFISDGIGVSFSWTYLTFSLTSAMAGLYWVKVFPNTPVRSVLWTKACILFSLFLMVTLDGPTVILSFLSYCFLLIKLSKREDSVLYEVFALIMLIVSWLLMRLALSTDDYSSIISSIEAGKYVEPIFISAVFSLVIFHCKNFKEMGSEFIRKTFRGIILGLIGGEMFAWSLHQGDIILSYSGLSLMAISMLIIGIYYKLNGKAIAPVIILLGLMYKSLYLLIYQQSAVFTCLTIVGSTLFLGWLSYAIEKTSIFTKHKFYEIIVFFIIQCICLMGGCLVSYYDSGLSSEFNYISLYLWIIAVLLLSLEKITYIKNMAAASLPSALVACLLQIPLFHLTGLNTTQPLCLALVSIYGCIGWYHCKVLKKQAVTMGNLEKSKTLSITISSMYIRAIFFLVVLSSYLYTKYNTLGAEVLIFILLLISIFILWISNKSKESAWRLVTFSLLLTASCLTYQSHLTIGFLAILFYFISMLLMGIMLIYGNKTIQKTLHASLSSAVISFMALVIAYTNTVDIERLGFLDNWTTTLWAVFATTLLLVGLLTRLRLYRVTGLIGLVISLIRLFSVDIQDGLWRILCFALTAGLFLVLGFVYSKFHSRITRGDLDWSVKE